MALQVSDGLAASTLNFTLAVHRWPLGIDDKASTVHRVYPIPASDVLSFDFEIDEEASITVVDMSGKQLILKEVAPSETKVSVDVSGLDEGTYMFMFQSGKESTVQTFVISR